MKSTIRASRLLIYTVESRAGVVRGVRIPSLVSQITEVFVIIASYRWVYYHRVSVRAKLGARLQLSGHTHGGSIIGLAPFVKNFNAGFVSGKYTVDDMTLLVCNGTGIWNGMPLRLGAPSEILLLELRRDQ